MQEKLFIIRKRSNLSIKDMAEFLEIAPKTYSEKERGIAEFTQDEMFLISCRFNMSIADIFLPRSHRIGDKVTT